MCTITLTVKTDQMFNFITSEMKKTEESQGKGKKCISTKINFNTTQIFPRWFYIFTHLKSNKEIVSVFKV